MIESVKQPAKLKKKILSPKQKKLSKIALGIKGENKAIVFLTKKGYQVLAKNLTDNKGREIDIIALDTKTDEIVFVEVKTRSSSKFGDPSETVNYKKIAKIKNLAKRWLDIQNLQKPYRFDIISILPNSIAHFENVTGGW